MLAGLMFTVNPAPCVYRPFTGKVLIELTKDGPSIALQAYTTYYVARTYISGIRWSFIFELSTVLSLVAEWAFIYRLHLALISFSWQALSIGILIIQISQGNILFVTYWLVVTAPKKWFARSQTIGLFVGLLVC